MKLKIWTYVTLAVAIGLAYYLFSRIKFSIDEERRIVNSEAVVIAKLKVIQEAEKAYQEVYGKYTSDWDSLINFIETGIYYVTERSEEIVMRPYGGDSTIVHIDTVDAISAKDYIFKAYHNIYTADSGQFVGLNVKLGQRVLKGQRVYTMINASKKQIEHTSKEDGTVDKIMELSGNVPKSELVMILLENKFDPNTNIARLPYIPGTDLKFEIFADKIRKHNLLVDVIEVKDVAPVNPNRSEDNEAKNRKPLRFGSRTDVTTAGNWE